jgi:hypothetical protein
MLPEDSPLAKRFVDQSASLIPKAMVITFSWNSHERCRWNPKDGGYSQWVSSLVAHEDHLCHRSPLELYEIRGVLGVF